MKKIFLLIALLITLLFVGCGNTTTTDVNITETETQETVSNLSESENNPTELSEQETNTLEEETENVIITYVRYNEKDGTVDFDDLLIEEVKANLEKRGLSYAEHSNEILGDYFVFTSDLDNTILHYDILDAIAERIQNRIENEIPIKELNQIMYATGNVNTRLGDSTDYEKIGSLTLNQEVLVTGISERTGWYRINVGGQEMFVSGSYLVTNPIQQSQPSGGGSSSGQSNSNTDVNSGQVGSEDDSFFKDNPDWGGSDGSSMDWSNNY